MSRQTTLWDDTVEIVHTDPNVPAEAEPRLGGQNGRVLERLRVGTATNIQLEAASGSRRINSRVADVRRWLQKWHGETIESEAVDVKTGVYRYTIVKT